eukprot:TRINITY_DN236_c1_g2_i2.p1 TRINITY_DN236_c1_g2~~TRINITY_DN236_c1_g2_i2.p1  ORF type:complete len:1638 (-),score=468.15 TRINITY_DN236_c1_g2_i2:274-4461(-)
METPAVVNLILLLLSKSEPTTEHMRTQWLDYLRKIKFVDLIISRITSSDPVHVNQMFMFCLRLVELMMRHDAIVSTWLFHDLLDTEEQFDKIMTCALSGSSLAAKRSADLLHIMFQKSVSAWDRLTELTVGNEPASLYVEMMADAFCSFASHGKKWVTAIGEFLACTRKEKMGEAVVLSHHTVHKPLTVTRQAVLELLCDFLQSDAMLIDSIPHSAWATMTNWFFELRYNSIYLVRFCYVLSIGIRMNREKILRWVLSGCKFLTRMINHFNEINLTEARGCIIDLCNTLRLKSESLNPRNFLPQLLTGHSLWRDFSKKMMELTVEFTKKKFFPITHNRDRFKRPSADALEQEDEETGLGSSYATKLGLGDLTPFVRPSRKRKSRSKVEERGNDDSINLCIPIAEEDEARMDEEFFHRLDKDMLDFLALSQSALMGSGNEGDDEEEEEEEEQDPVFKYHKLESSLSKIFENHSASCLCVHDKFVILGTHEGTLHVLDFNGNEVKTLPPHHVCVRDISVDANGEFVGSCSMGGLVNIHALYKEEKFQFAYERPLNSIALDPQYSKRSSRQFISGGKEGKLTLHSKGWFSTKENIIHSGEGTIYAIKWHKEYIAWANSEGVKVIDLSSMTKIVMIPRPKSVDIADLYRCCLVWHEYEDPLSTDSSSKKTGIFRGSGKRPLILELMVGWGDMVFVGRLEEYAVRQQARPTGSALMTSHPASGQTIVKKRMVPVSSFIVDCLVCGIAPFEEGILVLSNGDIFKEDTAITPSSKGTKGAPKSQPPVLRIFARDGEEVSSDELPVANFERNSPMDYRLEYYEGDLSYYILSLRDVIVARERTPDERIQWLLSKSKFERALEAAEAVVDQLQEVTLAQIGEKCMLHLMKENHYARAANYLPRVAKSDPEVWKKWIFAFGQSGMLRMILRKIPTATTMEDGTVLTLDQSTYAYVISTLMKKDPKSLLWVLETWPAEGILDPIVTAKNVSAEIDFLKTQLVQHKPVPDQSGVDKKKDGPEDIGNLLDKNSISVPTHIDILMDCLAELYIRTDNYGKALDIFLTLKKPKVFSFIEDHNLFHSVTHKVSALMELNPELSLAMFVRNLNDIDTRSVVSQLESKPEYIHRYLDAVFEKDATHASEFHEMQVELYAKYDKEKLLRFLQKSHFYPLEKACKICEERKLWEEAVFVLGRMGNLQEALSMIFREIKSVQKAIEFVEEHPDDELWEDLMNHCLKNGESIGELLDHFNPNIDPIVVIRKIPQGMKIPRLRDRLVRIITDYSLQRSLKEGCRAVLESDCMALAKRLMWLQTRAHFVKPRELVCSVCQMSLFDERRKGSIVAFACGHVYHALCLRTQATDDDKGRTGPQRIVSPGPPTSSRSRMICVVCHQEDPTETHEPRGHRKRG